MKLHHQSVERWMNSLVERRYSDFDYRGKLDRQHFSFVRTAVLDPCPVYHHLIFCYNRTARKLQIRVGVSLLHIWQLKRNPGRITYLSGMLACDLSGQASFKKSRELFESRSVELARRFLAESTKKLLEDEILQRALPAVHSGQALSREAFDAKLISDLKLVTKQHGQGVITRKRDVKAETSMEIRSFLQDLMPEDSEVTEGAFSLSVGHARRKMQSFQLSSPQNFVAHIVSGAIASGATGVNVSFDSDDIIVEFDGRAFSRLDLEDLLDSLLISGAPPRSRELAVALNAAQSLSPKRLRVESWDGERGYWLNLGAEMAVKELQESPFHEASTAVTRVSYRDQPSLKVLGRFLRSLNPRRAEIDVLSLRCSGAPVPVLVDRTDIRNLPLEDSAFYLHWEHPEHCLGDWDLSGLPGLKESSPGDFSLLLLVGPEPGLGVLVHGVRYQLPKGVNFSDCWGLLIDNQGRRDLSYTGIQDEARLQAALASLNIASETLYRGVLERFPRAEEREKSQLALYLRRALLGNSFRHTDLAIYETLAGKYCNAQSLTQKLPIGFTERKWDHPLRYDRDVFVLFDNERQYLSQELGLKSGSFECLDQQLELSQTYFRRRAEWEKRNPVQGKIQLPSGRRSKRLLTELVGELGYSKNFGRASLILYKDFRYLITVLNPELPRGLEVAVNWDGLEMDMSWTELLEEENYRRLISVVFSEIDRYYQVLLNSDSVHSKALLYYYIYRKKRGRPYKGLLERTKFRMWDGSVIEGRVLMAEGGMAGVEAAWRTAIHLSPTERSLLKSLLRV